MRGLDPRIHLLVIDGRKLDTRIKSGHDEFGGWYADYIKASATILREVSWILLHLPIFAATHTTTVMRGFDPRIHLLVIDGRNLDTRIKSAHPAVTCP